MKIKGTEVGTGRPLICVPVLEKTKEEVIKEVEYLVKSDADMIEWRLDAFEHYTDYNEVREILQQIAPLLKKKLFLYTFRTAKQGGVVSVDRETLNDLHDLAAESECVDLIDLEFFEEEHAAKRIRDMLPPLPQGVMPSYIQYLDVIHSLQREKKDIRLSDISDAMNLPRPGVTRTVKEMEAKGYLQKLTSPDDGRVTYISIT